MRTFIHQRLFKMLKLRRVYKPTLIFTAVTQNHVDGRKSLHTTKISSNGRHKNSSKFKLHDGRDAPTYKYFPNTAQKEVKVA